ncbi:MAG TPA: glycosyltransferase family 4 protein [Candidatus Saccharimonadales bacterium]|jgi:glycosyltransferase involved in cell wall biosynthesis|nr:glycosyltransferase family 4 protein [Candidatus Saccharimonadales bacterium]
MLHNRYLTLGGEDHSTAAEVALLTDSGCEVELLEEDNRRIEQLGNARTAVRTVWSSESYKRVYEKLRTGRFDILHVQNFFPLWSPSVYYAASRCGVPVVQTLRNYRLLCVTATFFRDNRLCQECLGRMVPWPGIVHGCYRGSRAGSAVLASMIGAHKLAGTWRKRVQIYIALTEFARNKYIEGGLAEEKIVVKPNFVHPTPAQGPGGGGYALFVGRLSPEKGIKTMLEAWKTAHHPLPLKVVGDGPEAEAVRAAAHDCPAIQYLGSRSSEEVLTLMRMAEFLVFPSEWFEGMPRTVIESFGVGTPVLASNIGATASMVTPGETGFHFEPGNAVDLREKISRCSRNLGEVRSLRAQARAEFELRYGGSANTVMLLAIYRKAQESMAGAANGKMSHHDRSGDRDIG